MGRTDIYGYDLDGVLCPDLDVQRILPGDLMSIVNARYSMKPLFIPKHDYFFIVTGRPRGDYQDTYTWAQNYFGLRCRLVHNSEDRVLNTEESAVFKSTVVEEEGITIFIESCEKIANRMAQLLPSKTIITFSELCILG